ncbi:MAG TPA: hypothetical protein DCR24_02935 [Bacillus bacterium]|nr:hypothetical protein [Bacillus sp. (in: firmicutes)]
MLDYKDASLRKQVASVLLKMAKKLEEDEEFAKLFFGEMKETAKVKKTRTKKAKPEEKPVKLDVFTIYQNQGAEGLAALLQTFEVQELRKVVLDNGFDPAQKVRRWRLKDKIIAFIIEAVGKQMAKGGAFLR